MRNPRHIALALTVVLIWGVNFVFIGIALEGFPPILLAAVRFVLTASAALFVPRPKVPWRWIAAVGIFTFAGQYGLLFTAMSQGMPEGLSSLVIQCQVPFTVLFAAVALRERTTRRQLAGIAVALAGLAVIGVGRGGSIPLGALLLTVACGASWAVGNVCNRQAKADNGFALMVWASVFAAPPLLALSLATEGPHRIGDAFAHLHTGPVLALAYVVLISTFIGMGAWVMLLGKYPASSVVPYALGVPPIGMICGALFHGEHVTGVELAGSAVVLAGLVTIVWNRAGAKGKAKAEAEAMAAAPATTESAAATTTARERPNPLIPSAVPAKVGEAVST
jgi:O-acetylserine/cysteine efflux transporter